MIESNVIYKISIALCKEDYRIRIEKFQCKETKTLYIVDYGSKRIKKETMGKINADIYDNSMLYVRYCVYVLDIQDKDEYIKLLKEKVDNTLKNYTVQISNMMDKFNTEPRAENKDRIESD